MSSTKPWRPGLLASVVVLLFVCPLVGRTILPRQATSVNKQPVRDEADPKDTQSCREMGELDIAYSSENTGAPIVGLVVSDPRGRRVGQDPIAHELWQELPLAQAFIDCDDDQDGPQAGACRGAVQICGPVSGTYKVEVIASQTGNYSVTATGSSAQRLAAKRLHSTDSEAEIKATPIRKGSRETLLLTYSRDPGTKLGFVKSEEPSIAGNR
jgi:hypothetical protein